MVHELRLVPIVPAQVARWVPPSRASKLGQQPFVFLQASKVQVKVSLVIGLAGSVDPCEAGASRHFPRTPGIHEHHVRTFVSQVVPDAGTHHTSADYCNPAHAITDDYG